MSEAGNNSPPNDLDSFLEMLRAAPGPARRSVDVARLLMSESTEAVLAAIVKDEFERQGE